MSKDRVFVELREQAQSIDDEAARTDILARIDHRLWVPSALLDANAFWRQLSNGARKAAFPFILSK